MHKTLLREAEKECIEVVYLPLRRNLKGLYYDQIIALNKKKIPPHKLHPSRRTWPPATYWIKENPKSQTGTPGPGMGL